MFTLNPSIKSRFQSPQEESFSNIYTYVLSDTGLYRLKVGDNIFLTTIKTSGSSDYSYEVKTRDTTESGTIYSICTEENIVDMFEAEVNKTCIDYNQNGYIYVDLVNTGNTNIIMELGVKQV